MGVTAKQTVVGNRYGAELVMINIVLLVPPVTLPSALSWCRLMLPWAVIASHASGEATSGGEILQIPGRQPYRGVCICALGRTDNSIDADGKCMDGCIAE